MSDDVLPPGWKQSVSKSRGCIYYFNDSTGESSWERPRADRGLNVSRFQTQQLPDERAVASEVVAQHESKRPRLSEIPPLAVFNAARQHLLTEGLFLDMAALEHAQRRHFGDLLPNEVSDALGGLQRVLASVNSALTTAFATHHLLTLRDLEAWVLWSSRDFQGAASFAELCLGPLSLHPLVLRYMPRAHDILLRSPHLKDLDAINVVSRVATLMDPDMRRISFSEGLYLFARELGLENASELPVYIRAESYLSSLVGRCLDQRRHIEQLAAQQAEREAAHKAQQAARQQLAERHVLGSAIPPFGHHSTVEFPDAPNCLTELLATVELETADAFTKDTHKSRMELGLLEQELAATREMLGRMRAAPDAMEAAREILRELHGTWSQHAVLCWSLPRIATLTLPISEATQLLRDHASGKGDVPLAFPPIFNNDSRKKLHSEALRYKKKISNYSIGEGGRRYLVVHRSELQPHARYGAELDSRFGPDDMAALGRAAVRKLAKPGHLGEGAADGPGWKRRLYKKQAAEQEEEAAEGAEAMSSGQASAQSQVSALAAAEDRAADLEAQRCADECTIRARKAEMDGRARAEEAAEAEEPGGGNRTKMYHPCQKWLSAGVRPMPTKWSADIPPSGTMPSTLMLHLIGKEIITPLVRALVYAVGCLAAHNHSGGAADTGRRTEGLAAEASSAQMVDADGSEDANGKEGDGPQETYRVLRVLDHVRALAAEDEDEAHDAKATTASSAAARVPPMASSPIARLADLEARLLRENDVTRFEELRVPHHSLLALLAAEASPALQMQLLSVAGESTSDANSLGHRRRWAPSTLLSAASRLLAQLSAASVDASPEQLYAALAVHYGAEALCTVAGVDGSAGGIEGAKRVIDSLRRSGAASEPSTQSSPSNILPACMLAMPFLIADQTLSGPKLLSAAAVAALLAAPPLVELESATRWPLLFESSVGPLRQFCTSTRSLASLVLELCDGCLIKLEAGTLSDLSSALHALEAKRAVALALYLCSSAGGAQHAPLETIRSEVSVVLAAAPSISALSFSLGCVDALPAQCPPSLLRLAASLFLSPLKAALPGAYRSLVAMADACQRPLLSHLGCMLGEIELVSSGLLNTDEAAPENVVMHEQPATEAGMAVAAAAVASSSIAAEGEGTLQAGEAAATTDAATPAAVASVLPTSGAAIAANVAEAAPRGDAVDASQGGEVDEPSCEEVCKAVARRFGCGIDSELDATGQEALKQLRGVTMRSIQRLAAELYGGNAHFLLEIIQNADDNRYPAHVVPQLCIQLPPDGCEVAFDNNEIGFSARNVLALCSMGESTKQAADANLIGNKGIGFKSVFKVTPRPRVHSRHFHFQFDARDGGLGYIVPSPASPPAGWDGASCGTRLVLPLEEDGLTKLRELRMQLADLKPSLLLFLRRLRRLEIDDASSGVRRCITMRHTESDKDGVSVVALLEEQDGASRAQQQRWLLVRRALEPKVERLGIRRTELVMAFPLVEQLNGWFPPQDVCAFLPLRSYGLRFILQAGALPPPPFRRMSPLLCPPPPLNPVHPSLLPPPPLLPPLCPSLPRALTPCRC